MVHPTRLLPAALPRRPALKGLLGIGLAVVAGILLISPAARMRPPSADAAPPTTVASCADVRAANPSASDGTYALDVSGHILQVYCSGMATTPADYLTLVQTGGSSNFSQYTAGGASRGSNVRTNYTRVRLDPSTLKVNIADETFSTSTGSLLHGGGPVTSMPYAVAMSCQNPGNPAGLGNIDLTGTPLSVVNTFSIQGFESAGTTTLSSNNQVVNLTGGGFCGWDAPAPTFNPFNTNPATDGNKGYDLQLAFVGPSGEAQCMNGGWQNFGSLFKNQGDCVSFLATDGRNQPAGNSNPGH